MCAKHGGNAPQVLAKSRQRLDALAEPALVELNKILRRKDVADADRLKAIAEVLDRIPGLTKRSAVEQVGQVDHDVRPSPEYLQMVERARARVNALERAGAFKGGVFRLEQVLEDDDLAVDAEVVEEMPDQG